LRWVYPDAFFHFQDTGELAITIRAGDFRRNETNPVLTTVGVQVVTDGSMPASGLRLSLATPGRAAAAAQTDAEGVVESDAPASPWTGLAGGSAVGDYLLAVRAADNPAWSTGGTLNLAPIVNVALVLGYSFTPRA
jgi:hypothetical protein